LIISMTKGEHQSLEQVRAFMEGSEGMVFKGRGKRETYGWTQATLCWHSYASLRREDKGLVKRYISKVTGLSRAQTTRLVAQYKAEGLLVPRRGRGKRFAVTYLPADVVLLAEVDEAHETLSGPATRKLLERAYHEFADARYERLANISSAHIYNLRKLRSYRERVMVFSKTRPTAVAIGVRRKPEPGGLPGYLRVDTVHQGDQDGVKGVYYINLVDEVTQFEVVGAVEYISESYLKPLLERLLKQFPFRILGFHSDNGSEFINHSIAKMLNKLLIEQTKSRPRKSNDNGLVESKNGSVIRKHMGFDHIGSEHAESINAFYEEYFNPYLNFHRPCGVPELKKDGKGKTIRVYKRYATPWEILRDLPEVADYLRDDITVRQLDRLAGAESDTGAATQMRKAKQQLFASFEPRRIA
jgi:transposase InsO family protein